MINEKKSRREFIRQLAVSGACMALPGWVLASVKNAIESHKPKRKPPNIILILADDQGYADASFNAHDTPIYTPNLERLAKRGVMFTDGYACASMCLPSRAGILTSRFPARMGIYDVGPDAMVGFPKDEKIAPQYFKELGYNTACIGKWHLGGDVDEFRYNYPLNKGFDRFWGFLDSTHDYWKANTGSGVNSGGYTSCGNNPIYDQEDPVKNIRYMTYEITDKSLEFIDENKTQPFFLYIAHHCPHPPLQVPKEIHDNYVHYDAGLHTTLTRGMYEAMDEGIGKILDKLKTLELTENTFIIYSSDNGGGEGSGQLNGKFRGGKFTFLEGGIRVPTVMSWPGVIPQNKIYGYPICNIDFLPTMLSAAGQGLDPKFEGVNLLPFLTRKNKNQPHDYLCWTLPEGKQNYAIREGNWKLVYTQVGFGLFNLTEDPGERHDMQAQYPDIVKRLQSHWDQWNRKNIPHRWTEEQYQKYWAKKQAANPEDRGSFQYSPFFGD